MFFSTNLPSFGPLKIDANWHLFSPPPSHPPPPFPCNICKHSSSGILTAFTVLGSASINRNFKKKWRTEAQSNHTWFANGFSFYLAPITESFTVRGRVTRRCPSTTTFEEKGELKESEIICLALSILPGTTYQCFIHCGWQCHKTVSINHNFWGDRAKGDSNYSFDGFSLYLAPVNVSFTVGARVTRRCQSTTAFEEIEERRRTWSIHSLQMAFHSTWHLSMFHALI